MRGGFVRLNRFLEDVDRDRFLEIAGKGKGIETVIQRCSAKKDVLEDFAKTTGK